MPPATDPMVGPGGVRRIFARWVITGVLELQTAAHLGSGEEGEAVDMPLVRDRIGGRPLLTGASLAGALRSHLLDRLDGYGRDEPDWRERSATGGSAERTRADRLHAVADLFGGARGDDEGAQSALIVFDSLGQIPADRFVEIRDGLQIAPTTGTAEEHKKFDVELLPPRTTFNIRLELVVSDGQAEVALVSLLVAALKGVEAGEILIGARRSRGLGECRVNQWRAKRFALTTSDGWRRWLSTAPEKPLADSLQPFADIGACLRAADPTLQITAQPDHRRRIGVVLQLQCQGGLLIRSPGEEPDAADAVQLTSGGNPVLSGTSLGGVLRARATRIAGVVREGRNDVEDWVTGLFGPRLKGTTSPGYNPQASRLGISESVVHEATSLRPSRVKIDRFTGGVVDGHLFDEEPAYGGAAEVRIELRNPEPGELGLLLLMVKDLLTGDLPVGGTSAVGRGFVHGTAEISIDGQAFTLDPQAAAPRQTTERLNQAVRDFWDAPRKEDRPS